MSNTTETNITYLNIKINKNQVYRLNLDKLTPKKTKGQEIVP